MSDMSSADDTSDGRRGRGRRRSRTDDEGDGGSDGDDERDDNDDDDNDDDDNSGDDDSKGGDDDDNEGDDDDNEGGDGDGYSDDEYGGYDEYGDYSSPTPEPKVLPKRKNRGMRMSSLVGEEAEFDEQFWGADIFKEKSDDEDFAGDSDDSGSDFFESDFDSDDAKPDAEREAEQRERDRGAKAEAALRDAEKEARARKRQKMAYVDPALKRVDAGAGGGKAKRSATATKKKEKAPVRRRRSTRSTATEQRERLQVKAAERAAKQARRVKTKKAPEKVFTQAELLAEAALTEVFNRESLRHFLADEAEKKKKRNQSKRVKLTGGRVQTYSIQHPANVKPGLPSILVETGILEEMERQKKVRAQERAKARAAKSRAQARAARAAKREREGKPKRKRGRPRKIRTPEELAAMAAKEEAKRLRREAKEAKKRAKQEAEEAAEASSRRSGRRRSSSVADVSESGGGGGGGGGGTSASGVSGGGGDGSGASGATGRLPPVEPEAIANPAGVVADRAELIGNYLSVTFKIYFSAGGVDASAPTAMDAVFTGPPSSQGATADTGAPNPAPAAGVAGLTSAPTPDGEPHPPQVAGNEMAAQPAALPPQTGVVPPDADATPTAAMLPSATPEATTGASSVAPGVAPVVAPVVGDEIVVTTTISFQNTDLPTVLQQRHQRPRNLRGQARCVITGRPARYRHPVTMQPYATPEAYAAINATLADQNRTRRHPTLVYNH